MRKLKPWLMLAGATLVLAACGGGGGDSAAAPPAQANPLDGVPVEATQSVSNWIDYLGRLIKTPDADGRDPAGLPTGTPSSLPTDDSSEPVTL